MKRRKICVVLVDRANYGRLKPVMHAIAERPELKLQVIAAGTMVLERFGLPVEVVRSDGFNIDGEIYIELEGSTPTTMAKSVGFAVVEFSSEFQRLRPDVVVLIGDRYEAFAAAIAAAYMNLCMVHIQGGEVSGSIDESARHAITKLAQYHFPSTHRSSAYLRRMGEPAEVILGVGCPSSDIARSLDSRSSTSPSLSCWRFFIRRQPVTEVSRFKPRNCWKHCGSSKFPLSSCGPTSTRVRITSARRFGYSVTRWLLIGCALSRMWPRKIICGFCGIRLVPWAIRAASCGMPATLALPWC